MADENLNKSPDDGGGARAAGAETAQPNADDAQESCVASASDDAAEAALDTAQSAARRIAEEAGGIDVPSAVNLPEFPSAATGGDASQSVELLSDVALNVAIELGRTKMYVEDVLRLNPNSIVELDKAAGDPVDIYVNGCHVARGEVLVLNENFCVRVSEIVSAPARTHTDEKKSLN
jgi:flagellar motor switch protein FliN/FliY